MVWYDGCLPGDLFEELKIKKSCRVIMITKWFIKRQSMKEERRKTVQK